MFMYLLKTAKDFIYIQKIQTYLTKILKPKNERNRFKRKNAIQMKNKMQQKVNLNDQIARFQKQNSRRNCYIFKSKSKQETKPNWIPKRKT